MFIAGMSTVSEPPINDIWTLPDEANLLAQWQKEDHDFFKTIDPTQHYHKLQIQDILQSILEDRAPMVTGEEGRKTVELFTAIYRSQREQRPVKFPLYGGGEIVNILHPIINFGRYCSASAKCTDSISSLPARSAIVRASFRMR